MSEDKTFSKENSIDVAGLFGNKDTGQLASHIIKKLQAHDSAEAISGASGFDHARIYKHVETGETAHQHFQRVKGRKAASVHELAKHFHEHRHSFMGHKQQGKQNQSAGKKDKVSKPSESKGYN